MQLVPLPMTTWATGSATTVCAVRTVAGCHDTMSPPPPLPGPVQSKAPSAIAQVPLTPVVTDATSAGAPAGRMGDERLLVVPSPSSIELFFPQHHSRPSSLRAQL